MATISKNVFQLIRQMHTKKKELSGKALRVQMTEEQISEESFDIGFDEGPKNPTDRYFTEDGVSVVMDRTTAEMLANVTIDFRDGCFTLDFDAPPETELQ